MSKRFIDNGFLDQKWIRKLNPEHKIFLIYLMLKCDNGGIIDLDFEDASFWIGKEISSVDFLPEGYLVPINDTGKYFMPKFIDWQYSDLSSNKNIVQQARQILEKYNLINKDFTLNLDKSYINVTRDLHKSYVTSNSNSKGKGKGKEGVQGEKINEVFENFRKAYPGTKGGYKKEFDNFKKHDDWNNCIEKLLPALENQINIRSQSTGFVPEWRHLKTWLNNRGWEDELQITTNNSKNQYSVENLR